MPLASAFAGKRVLVTGASGFIGSHLSLRLCGAGAEVHAISRKPRTSVHNCPHWWQGDLCDPSAVRRLVSAIRPELIFHLAGDTRANRDLDLVLPIFNDSVATTVNLLTFATQGKCLRIVLAGSLEEPEPRAVPSSPYAAAHSAIQAYAQMFHRIFGTPVVVGRIFMAYGPGQEALQKVVPYVTLAFLRGQAPKLTSGARLVDWIYVDDVAEGLLAFARAPDVEGYTLDLGSGTLVSIRTVVQELIHLAGSSAEPMFNALPDRPLEQVRVADVYETYAKTGWKARTPLESGLRKTVAWYRNKLEREAQCGKRAFSR